MRAVARRGTSHPPPGTVPRLPWRYYRFQSELEPARQPREAGCTSSTRPPAFANAAKARHAPARASDCMPCATRPVPVAHQLGCVAAGCSCSRPALHPALRWPFEHFAPGRWALSRRPSALSATRWGRGRSVPRTEASPAHGDRRQRHCCPKAVSGYHRLSCGRLDQPIESEPVVQAASCIVRSVMSAGRGLRPARGVGGGEEAACQHDAEGGPPADACGAKTPRTRTGEGACPRALTLFIAPRNDDIVSDAGRGMSRTWVTQVRRPGCHPHDRRPHLQEEFSVRGRYKGTYSVQSTPVPGNAWSEAVPVPPSPKQAITPDWDAVTRGIALPQRRLADLRNALGLWKRKTRAVNQVRGSRV